MGANFPHLQPMAELQMKQKSEIGWQHVKAHYAYWQPCTDLCIFAWDLPHGDFCGENRKRTSDKYSKNQQVLEPVS